MCERNQTQCRRLLDVIQNELNGKIALNACKFNVENVKYAFLAHYIVCNTHEAYTINKMEFSEWH